MFSVYCRKSDNSLNIPRKTSMFIWRLGHNSLPVKMKLKCRGLDLETLCLYVPQASQGLWAHLPEMQVCQISMAVSDSGVCLRSVARCANASQTLEALMNLNEKRTPVCSPSHFFGRSGVREIQ
jgi:hypothetical protein